MKFGVRDPGAGGKRGTFYISGASKKTQSPFLNRPPACTKGARGFAPLKNGTRAKTSKPSRPGGVRRKCHWQI